MGLPRPVVGAALLSFQNLLPSSHIMTDDCKHGLFFNKNLTSSVYFCVILGCSLIPVIEYGSYQVEQVLYARFVAEKMDYEVLPAE